MPRLKAPQLIIPAVLSHDPRASYVNGYNEAVMRFEKVFAKTWERLSPRDKMSLRRTLKGYIEDPTRKRYKPRAGSPPVDMPCRCAKKYTVYQEDTNTWVCTVCGTTVEGKNNK